MNDDTATSEIVETTEGTSAPQETVTTEAPAPEQFDELGLKYDVDSIPEDIREAVQEQVKCIEKQFKSTFTKKTQGLSEREKTVAAEVAKLQEENSQWKVAAREVMTDPSKLEAWRQIYGPQLGISKPIETPQFETVEDVKKYIDDQSAMIDQKVSQITKQQVTSLQREMRWESAVESLEKTEPKFSKWKTVVAKMATTDDDIKGRYNGFNEREILDLAFNKLKSLVRDELEDTKKSTLASMEKKKSVSTMTPKKTVKTVETPQAGLSYEQQRDKVLSAVRAKVGG